MESYDLPDNNQVNFTLESYEQPNNDTVNFVPGPEEPPEQEDFELDLQTVILISSILMGTIYTAFQLRSLLAFFGWMLIIVTFSLTLVTNLPLYWVWISIIGELFILMLAYVEYSRARERAND